ncbi:MAG: hypothetical protein AB8C02_04430 [Halioglobus sp.]
MKNSPRETTTGIRSVLRNGSHGTFVGLLAALYVGHVTIVSAQIDASLKPLLNTQGAQAGLKGCLNRGLYVNGPHTLTTTTYTTASKPYWDTMFSDTVSTAYHYNVLKVSDDGVSEVDVKRTVNSSSRSSAITSVLHYELEGHQLRLVGPNRNTQNPNAYVEHFDLEEGVEIPQTINAGTDASPIVFTRLDTYRGREEINIEGRAMKACRVDSLLTADAQPPKFRRWSLSSTWYAVGTGLTLQVESTTHPDSEQDTLLETKVMTAAELNGVKLF